LNRSITNKEIESLISNFPTKKRSESDGFTAKTWQTFKE
jgi:hypothetical protein